MSKKSRINVPKASGSSRLTVIDSINYDTKPPLFSLEKIVGDKYCFSNLDTTAKKQFAESIFKRRNLTWSEIQSTGRHGLGFEKIPRGQIKGSIPKFVTEDLNEFLSFRFHGKHPMVGYREKNIFYVLWFDHDFTLYNH